AAGAFTVAVVARLIADVRRSWRYDRMKKVYNPIADKLREHAPYLARLTQEPGFRLPALNVDALHRRISQGCKNVEERGLFVTRHLRRQRRGDAHRQRDAERPDGHEDGAGDVRDLRRLRPAAAPAVPQHAVAEAPAAGHPPRHARARAGRGRRGRDLRPRRAG